MKGEGKKHGFFGIDCHKEKGGGEKDCYDVSKKKDVNSMLEQGKEKRRDCALWTVEGKD